MVIVYAMYQEILYRLKDISGRKYSFRLGDSYPWIHDSYQYLQAYSSKLMIKLCLLLLVRGYLSLTQRI